jgi:hypothetical protein
MSQEYDEVSDEDQIEDNWDENSEDPIPLYSITGYGADYPVDGLVKRIRDDSIYIPSFQRGYVWDFKQASRFIESLLLDLPVPGIFLAKEEDSGKLLVIDGQQRLLTLCGFYDGKFPNGEREFALKNVQPQFENLTYDSLFSRDRRNLDDYLLHATIVKQDEPSDDQSSIYHVFERLNSGGTKLNHQEIRACIYHGRFNDLLKELNQNEHWRSLYGRVQRRMRDQEFILRFFALYYHSENYNNASMKSFLNKYMGKNKNLAFQSADELTKLFETTVEVVHNCLGSKAFKPQKIFNVAIFDAIMVGLARRLENGLIQDCDTLLKKYQTLLASQLFREATETGTTSQVKSLTERIRLATEAFADVK